MFFGVGAVGRQSIVGKRGVQGATLDLGFMSPGVLDPRITFTRASTGTYFDSSGVMQTAPMNVVFPSIPDGTWGISSATLTAASGTSPDGANTMVRMAEAATTAFHTVYAAVALTASVACTASVFVKAAQDRYLQVMLDNGAAAQVFATFDAQTGTISGPLAVAGGATAGAATIQAVGNGVYRCAISGTLGAFTTGRILLSLSNTPNPGALPSYAGNAANGLLIWGAQVELGSVPTPYIPTTTAANGAPRWDYDPATHALRGLLIEEARTNIILSGSNIANGGAWALLGIGVSPPVMTAAAAIAPDGTLTAARADYPAVSGASRCLIYQGVGVSAAVYVFSVYLRGNAGGEQCYIGANGSTYISQRVTLTTSWQRFTLAGTLDVNTWYFDFGTDGLDGSQTGTPAQSIFLWGAQLELGAFPTSYIPTTAASVTRAIDMCGITPANMAPWFAPPGGSWFAEFIDIVPAAPGPRIIAYPSGGAPSPLYFSNTNQLVQFDSVVPVVTANTATINAVTKGASAWAAGGVGTVCLNAGAVASGSGLTNGYGFLGTGGLQFMTNGTAGENMSGYVRRVRYWPRVLTNAEMQSVTT